MEILFEDEALIAVNKPSGVPSNFQNQSKVGVPSIEEALKRQRAPSQVFLLHRLDVGTSGVLLFAKSEVVYEKMRAHFESRQIRKFYWAWSEHLIQKPLPLEIQSSLAHHPKSDKRMIVVDPEKMSNRPKTFYRGKPLPALTRIHSVEPCEWKGIHLYRYQVEIITGVMHQIRVHLASIGIPLAGDALYNKSPGGLDRLGLHAHQVEFKFENYLYQIEAPAP